jgi:hypothetical protein
VAQSETGYSLDLQGPTWDNSIINILITPPSNESWWKPSYLNATLHAISEWNEAIANFAANHSDFAYLSQVRIAPQVSNSSTNTDVDAYLSWIQQFGNVTCEAGLSRIAYTSGIITNNSITISAIDCRGNVLSEADSQNVVLHELGHGLGLGHSNYTGDLMYYAYTLNSPVRAISTLDLYGVATVFRWMYYSSEFNQTNEGSPINSVTLPSDIPYEYLPVSEKNLPPKSPLDQIRIYLGYVPDAIAQPEFWILMVVFAVVAVTAIVILRRTRKKHVFQDNLASTKQTR